MLDVAGVYRKLAYAYYTVSKARASIKKFVHAFSDHPLSFGVSVPAFLNLRTMAGHGDPERQWMMRCVPKTLHTPCADSVFML